MREHIPQIHLAPNESLAADTPSVEPHLWVPWLETSQVPGAEVFPLPGRGCGKAPQRLAAAVDHRADVAPKAGTQSAGLAVKAEKVGGWLGQ